jgi:hypothetical protein
VYGSNFGRAQGNDLDEMERVAETGISLAGLKGNLQK